MADESKVLGKRVQAYRKRLGLSQTEFAKRVGRSETWLSQVERGVRRIDRVSVLERLAEALDVPLAELAPESNVVVAGAEKPRAATEIALALSSSAALGAVLAGRERVDVDALDRTADEAWTLAHGSRYDELARLLTDLVPMFEHVVRGATGADRRRACVASARVYHAVSAVLAKLGEDGAAWVAVDRAISFAEMAGDPLLMGEGAFRLALVFQASRRFDLAYQAASTARDALEGAASGAPEGVSVRGALTLQLAVISARQGKAQQAYSWLAQAQRLGAELGGDRNDYNTEFGPTNVQLHEVAVAVELGDAGRALRAAATVDADGLSPERRARFVIDVARAHAQRRQIAGVVEALNVGLRVAPQQIATLPLVRELVDGLLAGEHSTNADLQELNRRLIAAQS